MPLPTPPPPPPQERDALSASLSEREAGSGARLQELQQQLAALASERDALKERAKQMGLEQADLRGQVELQVGKGAARGCGGV
jgi:hypothetical protein